MAEMAGMAERQKEWPNGRMAEMATYVLFTVHTDTDDDDDTDTDDDDTLIFYSIDTRRSFNLGYFTYFYVWNNAVLTPLDLSLTLS